MKDYKLHTTEGFKDSFGIEMLVKKEIERRIIDLYCSYGYELIKTPTVEFIDVYSTNGMQKPDLYNLINRQGEVLSLCNDMTSSIARFVCSNYENGIYKYCYSADVFRYPKQYQGKEHQFLQAGIEFIGQKGISTDTEVIYLAYKSLKKCNVNELTIHIGSALFLEKLFNDFKIDNNTKKIIYECIETKDYVRLYNFLNLNLDNDKANFIYDLMLRGGKLNYINNLINNLNGEAVVELEYLKSIYLRLFNLGVDNVIFDFSIYSYARYYTGVVFSLYVPGISKAVVEGGRCDCLFKTFGHDFANVGFGLDINSLTNYSLINKTITLKNERYLSFVSDYSYVFANANNDIIREKGIIVNSLDFNSLNEALAYAKKHCYSKLLHYKNNSIEVMEVELCWLLRYLKEG